MVLRLKKTRLFVMCCVVFVTTAALWYGFFTLIKANTFVFSIDPFVSEVEQENIKKFCADYSQKNGYQCLIVKELIKQFPAFDLVQAHHQVPGTMNIIIKVAYPVMGINKHLLLENGVVTPQECFSSHAQNALPSISFKGEIYQLSPALKKYLLLLDCMVLKKYSLHIENEHSLIFTDKQNPLFSIKTDVHTPLLPLVLKNCIKVQERLLNDKAKNSWIADVRFKDQIVLKKIKGVV